ncbi:Veg family protein [Paraclostridium sordellii]|uniref:Veg family protein n=1 Tax=Paraclostridium sordellii TaxID=1505 RepID=UPI001C615CB1|nr:Veg family protein [Paeniclostridium sordellii]QYE97946.1 Veg family protein [Paeniclostridium sordellii]
MATVQTLNKIRQTLEKHLGRKIVLKANKGRKQIVTKKGILEKVYPSIFVVKLDDEDNGYSRVSYSYSDLLTDNVTLKVIKETNKLNVS